MRSASARSSGSRSSLDELASPSSKAGEGLFGLLNADTVEIVLRKMAEETGGRAGIPGSLLVVCKLFYRTLTALASSVTLHQLPTAPLLHTHHPHLTKLLVGASCRASMADPDLAHLTKLPQLRHVDLSGCHNLTDLAPLSYLKSLQHLDLRSCHRLADATISHLQHLTALQHLDLSACERLTMGAWAPLGVLTRLSVLRLSGTYKMSDSGLVRSLSGSAPQGSTARPAAGAADGGGAHLANLPQLRHLDLSRCMRVTDADLAHVATLSQLERLSLACCRNITDVGLAALAALSALIALDVSHCEELTDAGVWHLRGHASLRELVLVGCHSVTDAAVHALRRRAVEVHAWPAGGGRG